MDSVRLSLRTRILLAIFVVVVPFLALVAYELRADYERRLAALRADQLQTAQAVAAVVDSNFDEGLTLAWALSVEQEVLTLDSGLIDPYLQARRFLFPQYENIAVFDAAGRNVGSAVPVEPTAPRISIADRPYFQELMATNREQTSDVLVGRIVGRPTVILGAPIRGPDGAPRGMASVVLDLDRLPGDLARVRLSSGQAIFLADRSGRLAFHTGKPDLTWEERDYSGVPAVQRALAGEDVVETDFLCPLLGDYRLAAVTPTPKHGWVVGVSQPTDVALAPIRQAIRRDVAAAIVIILLAIGLGLFISRRVLEPVRRLTRYCQEVREALARGGDAALGQRVEVKTNDELEVLGESLNAMAGEVRRRIGEVEQANARLVALNEMAKALAGRVAMQDVADTAVARGMKVLEADSAALWIADAQRQELRLVAWRTLSPETVAKLRSVPFDSPLVAAKAARTGEVQVVEDYLAEAQVTPLTKEIVQRENLRALVALPVRTHRGPVGVLVYAQTQPRAYDAADRKTAEAVADMLAVALERAQLVEDLRAALAVGEEFLNLAAHELRTPLTTLKGYAQVLAKRGGHTEEERQLFKVINAQSDRMARLIEAMVDVSQIQGGELVLHRTQVDLCGLVRDEVRAMEPTSPRHQFSVSCDGPAVVEADQERVREVVFNLLDNAVRYSPYGGPIQAAVWTQRGEGVVCVRDHGIGIPRDRQEKLFQLFYQVTPMVSPTRGMGLGLYISREVIRRHGGRIWFESEEGRGSTFCFSLPLLVNGSRRSDQESRSSR